MVMPVNADVFVHKTSALLSHKQCTEVGINDNNATSVEKIEPNRWISLIKMFKFHYLYPLLRARISKTGAFMLSYKTFL